MAATPEIKMIAIDLIDEGARLRPLNTGYVPLLAESIAKIGLLAPIGVYQTPRTGRWQLVHGLHRLSALRHLGRSEARCIVLPGADADIAEAHENLIRNELSLLERADVVIRMRTAHEDAHGKIARGGDQGAKGHVSLWSDVVDDVADRLGVSTRTIKRWQHLSTLLPELRALLYGTPHADAWGVLSELAKMTPERQGEIVSLARLGTLDDAIAAALTPKDAPTPAQGDTDRVIASFARLPVAHQRRAAVDLVKANRAAFAAALRAIDAGDADGD